ncbi:MAG: hypothetical protein IPQ05_06300, partial [Leptospiraceae bacterium]|nr:hypothetical protein [Leptospiraceae bacterium]
MTVVDVKWWSLIWTIEAMSFIDTVYLETTIDFRYAGIGLISVSRSFCDCFLGFTGNSKENTRV